MMSGDVTVHSVPGEGSVFTIKLPATVIEPVAVEPEALIEDRRLTPAVPDIVATDGEPVPAPRTCVLVIDDDPLQRDLMQRYLRKEGFTRLHRQRRRAGIAPGPAAAAGRHHARRDDAGHGRLERAVRR